MLFLLPPAKSLDYDTPVRDDVPHTQPQFVRQSKALIGALRQQSPRQIAEHLNGLQAFDLEGYAFNADVSSPERLVFRRSAV
jgi:cytoplasmic iron level regulating protein YaaA (DUF328/UPF0246 family)